MRSRTCIYEVCVETVSPLVRPSVCHFRVEILKKEIFPKNFDKIHENYLLNLRDDLDTGPQTDHQTVPNSHV